MQIFKTFLKLAFRSLSGCLFYLAIFTGLSFFLANTEQDASAQNGVAFQTTAVKIALIDNDKSVLSTALCENLSAHQNPVEIASDPAVFTDELFYHTVEYILVIDEGFFDAFLNGNTAAYLHAYENPSSNQSYIIASQIESYLDAVRFYQAAGLSTDDAVTKADEITDLSVSVSFYSASLTGEEENAASAITYFFRYVPYMMVCILINSMGPIIVIWNRPAIKIRTAVSALSARSRNSGVIGACLSFGGMIFVLFTLLTAVVYRSEIAYLRTAYYLLNAFCYLFVSCAVTFVAAQFCTQTHLLNMWANTVGLSTSFLSGVFVARDLLPDGVVAFSKCLPTYWYINVTQELAYFDGSISALAWRSLGVQLLYAAALFVIGLVVIRAKRQRMA